MTKTIRSINIRLASPESILNWSKGEVKKPETFNYRTYKPERDGLFCEKIFGPTKDFECACGKYKKVRYAGTVCERCGVKVTYNKVRRKWLGHIKLACPVTHIWFTKSIPNRLSALLGINAKEIEKIVYYVNFIATHVNDDWLNHNENVIKSTVEAEIKKLKKDKEVIRNVQTKNILEIAIEADEVIDQECINWIKENYHNIVIQRIEINTNDGLETLDKLIGCKIADRFVSPTTEELIVDKGEILTKEVLEKIQQITNDNREKQYINVEIKVESTTAFSEPSLQEKANALKHIIESSYTENKKSDDRISAIKTALLNYVLGGHIVCNRTFEIVGLQHQKIDYALILKLLDLQDYSIWFSKSNKVAAKRYQIPIEEKKHDISDQKRLEEIENHLRAYITALDIVIRNPKEDRKLKTHARITDPEKESLDSLRNLLQRECGLNLYDAFQLRMGAEAILQILKDLDLDKLCTELEKEYETAQKKPSVTNLKAKNILKRLKMVRSFMRKDAAGAYINRPEWMILSVLPVLPPDLRPMVELDGGRFASSDLNDLYRRVINRNNRLHKLINIRAPESILRNEKRMLQEAVDNLIDNGRKGKAAVNTNNRALKSLSDMLKGKQGRFRQNLLGKRVDYSGRSVIVVGPKLKLHQCGIPKFMALELFKPFVLNRLINPLDPHQNIAKARQMIEKAEDPQVWDALADIIHNHPVLLNRAPTLHRLSIQAFEPVLIEGKAIQIHPLVCTAYNADFDGDQMAVHVPLSTAAQAEARVLMLSTNNLLLPANGNPIVSANQDMVLGIYYMTQVGDDKLLLKEEFEYLGGNGPVDKLTALGKVLNRELTKEERENVLRKIPVFSSEDEVLIAFGNGVVGLQDFIRVPIERNVLYTGVEYEEPETWEQRLERSIEKGNHLKLLLTTVGCVIFNQAIHNLLLKYQIPKEKHLPYYNYAIKKSHINSLVAESYMQCGQSFTTQLLDVIKDLGFEMACKAGITISVSDIVIPPTKEKRIQDAQKEVDAYTDQFISAKERNSLIIQKWDEVTRDLVRDMRKNFDTLNPIFMMAESGARGKVDQVRQLAALRGLMAVNISDLGAKTFTRQTTKIIPTPIKTNFREGLSVLEYFISTYGSRKGLVDTALKTSESGYLTRRLVDVALDVTIREKDCCETLLTDGMKCKFNIIGVKAKEDLVNPNTGDVILKKGKAALESTQEQCEALISELEQPESFRLHLIDVFEDAKHPGVVETINPIPYIEYDLNPRGEYSLRKIMKLLLGRVSAETVVNTDNKSIVVLANAYIDHLTCKKLFDAKIKNIKIRSVLTCKTVGGVCSKCYGWDLSNLRPVELGEPIGVVAAQSIGEPGTQLTMRTFHTGGIGGEDVTQISQGLPALDFVFEMRQVDANFKKYISPIVEEDGVISKVVKVSPWKIKIREIVPDKLDALKGAVPEIDLCIKETNLQSTDGGSSEPKAIDRKVLAYKGKEINAEALSQIKKAVRESKVSVEDLRLAFGEEIIPRNIDLQLDYRDRERLRDREYYFHLEDGAEPAVKRGEIVELGQSLNYLDPTDPQHFKAEFQGQVIEREKISLVENIDFLRPYWKVVVKYKNPDYERKVQEGNEAREFNEKVYEAPYKKLLFKVGSTVKRGDRLLEGSFNLRGYHEMMGDLETQIKISKEISDIYESQNVDTNMRHIEVIVRQMIRHVQINHPGCMKGKWFEGDLVDRGYFNKVIADANARDEKDLPQGTSLLQGISKSSLSSKSFLAAASFQETTKVLTEAAIEGKTDPLRGLKENVLIGGLIPIGTGRDRAQNLEAHAENIDKLRLESRNQPILPPEEKPVEKLEELI